MLKRLLQKKEKELGPAIDEVIKKRWECERFRILVIGRANSGKTTILQKVCNTTKHPDVFRNGKKLDPSDQSVLAPTAGVGLHNIEDELIFSSNPDFVFHDSPGFESGSRTQVETVKEFIAKRAQCKKLKDQLHAIWYCLPTDNDRPFPASEKEFFNQCGTGKVPVISIFTKYDGLIVKAYAALRDEGLEWEEARKGEAARADAMFQQIYLAPLYQTRYPPARHVQLGNMHKADVKCPDLIDKTAQALTNDVLKMLFVSVQQNNFDTNIKYAVEWGFFHSKFQGPLHNQDLPEAVKILMSAFPHTRVSYPLTDKQPI